MKRAHEKEDTGTKFSQNKFYTFNTLKCIQKYFSVPNIK